MAAGVERSKQVMRNGGEYFLQMDDGGHGDCDTKYHGTS
jgi:hypothetical protein